MNEYELRNLNYIVCIRKWINKISNTCDNSSSRVEAPIAKLEQIRGAGWRALKIAGSIGVTPAEFNANLGKSDAPGTSATLWR
jgi:hypothetical protein